MRSAWEEVQPNHIYQVFKSVPLTEEGNDGLSYLYQPIIGAQAMALYYALIGDSEDKNENEFVHIDMLNALNLGLPDFLKARKRLEGMGLLSVFIKDDPEFGRMFLYRLEEPLHPQSFFQDELYSFLLWSAVGERKFNQMVSRFKPKAVTTSSYQEITSSFSDVYGAIREEAFARKEDELEQVSKEYQLTGDTSLTMDDNRIDWDFLMDFAKRKYIDPTNFTADFKRKLTLYQNLYGFDEIELVNLMASVVSLTDGQVSQKELDKLVNRQMKQSSPKKQQESLSETEETRRFNTLRQTGFSENDIGLIQLSESTAPADFLQAIKQEKRSFVTDSENWLLKSLVERSPLPNSVINVLMHYVLAVQKNSSLQANFVNKIATDWSELQITSPEEAIRHVRQLVKESKEAKTTRNKPRANNYQKPIRKETLPDWVDNPQEEVEDPDMLAKMQKSMQEYLKSKEGES